MPPFLDLYDSPTLMTTPAQLLDPLITKQNEPIHAEHQFDASVNISVDVAEEQRSDTAVNNPGLTSILLQNCDLAVQFASLCETVIFVLHTFACLFGVVGALPLLLASLFVIRLLQFISRGDRYEQLVQVKLFIRTWMLVSASIILPAASITFAVVAIGSSNPMLIGLALSEWAVTALILIGFYCASHVFLMITREIPRVSLELNESGVRVAEAVSEVVDCLLVWWSGFEVVRRVPALKQQNILGLHPLEWIEMPIFSLIGYNVIAFSTHMIVWSLQKVCESFDPGVDPHLQRHSLVCRLLHRKHLVYCANGVVRSINFILGTLLVLLLWWLYIGARLESTPEAIHILQFGTLTCISFLVCSLLWLLKTFISLSWKARAIYCRFDSKILSTAKKLYFLGILGRHDHDIFNLRYSEVVHTELDHALLDARTARSTLEVCTSAIAEVVEQAVLCILKSSSPEIYVSLRGKNDEKDGWSKTREVPTVKKLSIRKRQKVQHDLLRPQSHAWTTYDIEQLAQYLLRAQSSLSKESYTSDIIHHLKTLKNNNNNDGYDSCATMMDALKELVAGDRSSDDNAELVQDPNVVDGCVIQTSREANQWSNDWEIFIELLKEHSYNSSVNIKKILKERVDGISDSNNTGPDQFDSLVKEFDNEIQNPKGSQSSSEIVLEEEKMDVPPKEEMSFFQIRTWVEKAHADCLFLANMLSSAKEVVDCLNNIIGVLLIVATFIMWLLLTGLATKEVFVAIASPLLAATFVFGDTCRTLFQGIIFIYVVHPYDVGDLCIIGGKAMVVKAIGVWRTTFSKVDNFGSRGEVTYPNFELANKMVINHKTEFNWDDWDDYIEFDLGPAYLINIDQAKKLKWVIEDHLQNCKEEKFMPRSHSLELSTMEANVKIIVHLKYKIGTIGDDQDWTYSDRLKQKDDLRDEFCVYIYNLVEKFKGKMLNQ